MCDIGDLNTKNTASYIFIAVISYKAKGLGFFNKIVLFFNQLFNPPKSMKVYTSDYKKTEKYTFSVPFGNAKADLTVNVWFSHFSDDEIRKMNFVDEAIATNGESSLSNLENNGYVSDITKSDGIVTFKYSNGVLGGFKSEKFTDSNYEDNTTSVIPQTIDQSTKNIYEKYSVGDVLILYSFNYPSDDQQCRRYFYDGKDSASCVNTWGKSQLNTDIDTSVTVRDLKNIKSKYKIVCFSGHGSIYNGSPVMCLTEKVTDKNRQEYADDLINGRITTVRYDGGTYYWVYPELFSYSYSGNKLKDKFMFIQSCEAFGEGEKYDYSFADAMTKSGASAVAGFHNSVNSIYGRDFMKQCVCALSEGKTAKQAYDSSCKIDKNTYENNEGIPVFRGSEKSTFIEYATVNISVIDRTGNIDSVFSVKVKSGDTITMEKIELTAADIYGKDIYLTKNINKTAKPNDVYNLTATI